MATSSGLRFGLNVPISKRQAAKRPLLKQTSIVNLFEPPLEEKLEKSQAKSAAIVGNRRLQQELGQQHNPHKHVTDIKEFGGSKGASSIGHFSEEIKQAALQEDPLLFDYDASMNQLEAAKRQQRNQCQSECTPTSEHKVLLV
jgi:hypothetical protein